MVGRPAKRQHLPDPYFDKNPDTGLTLPEENFVVEYLANGLNQTGAFRECFPHECVDAAPANVWKKSSVVLARARVQRFVERMRSEVMPNSSEALTAHRNALLDHERIAREDSQHGPSLAARKTLIQLDGHLDKQKDTGPSIIFNITGVESPPSRVHIDGEIIPDANSIEDLL